jgi:hypothetical protein
MPDLMHYRFHRVVTDAAQFRMMQRIYASDPKVGPGTVELLVDCLRANRDDAADVLKLLGGAE